MLLQEHKQVTMALVKIQPKLYYSLTHKRTKQPQPSPTKDIYACYIDLLSHLSSLLVPKPSTFLEAMLRQAIKGEVIRRRGIYADIQRRQLVLYQAAEHIRKAQQALEAYQRLP